MKRELRTGRPAAAALAGLALLAFASPSFAEWDTSYPPDGDHPLRIVYYFVAPVGTLLEWTVTRPLAVMGHVVAPYSHIGSKRFSACSRERPGRSCTEVTK